MAYFAGELLSHKNSNPADILLAHIGFSERIRLIDSLFRLQFTGVERLVVFKQLMYDSLNRV